MKQRKKSNRGRGIKKQLNTIRLKKAFRKRASTFILPIMGLTIVAILLITIIVFCKSYEKKKVAAVKESISARYSESLAAQEDEVSVTTIPETSEEEPVIIIDTDGGHLASAEELESMEEEENKLHRYDDLIIGTRETYDTLNIRKAPSKDSEIVTTVDPGAHLQITDERSDGWTEIVLEGDIYYVYSHYIGTGTDEDKQRYLDEEEAMKDHTPYSEYLKDKYGFSYDLQKFLWDQVCTVMTKPINRENYYCFLLGIMQQETQLGTYNNKSHWNSNGTRDLGIMQVNSCNWGKLKAAGIISTYDPYSLTCDELQYDDYVGIRAGMYFVNQYVEEWGISEKTYAYYNTGSNRISSNKNSKKVWQYYLEWRNRLYGR